MATRMMMAAATLGALSSKMVGDIFFPFFCRLDKILGVSEVGNKLLRVLMSWIGDKVGR